MIRLTLALLGTIVLLFGVAASGTMSRSRAQDTSDERVSALETQVAELEDVVERQGRRLSQLADADEEDEKPSPTPTERQSFPTATAAAGGGASTNGTRTNPIPVGKAVSVGDWTLTVERVQPDGTELVLMENQFNDPPLDGRQFFLIDVSATLQGEEASSVIADLSFKAVGQSNVAYSTYDPSCGVVPNELGFDEVFPGGTLEGTVCFQVEEQDVGSLVMYVEPSFSFTDDDRAWLDVQP